MPRGKDNLERSLTVLGVAVVLAPAWLRGGTHAPWTLALAPASLALLLFLACWSLVRRGRAPADARPPPFFRLTDPVFACGLILNLLLLVQWLNAGRELAYDPGTRLWSYGAPDIPWLPSAIQAGEARQMLDWFLPAWLLALVFRSPLLSPRSARRIWRGIAYQAGLLALLGLIQYLAGAERMAGWIPMRHYFFATFGYPNHAGSYFLLTMGLSAGLLSWELEQEPSRRRTLRVVALSAVLLLALLGANLCLSRFAVMVSWLLLALLAVLLSRFLWPRLLPVQRVHLLAVAAGGLCLAAMLAVGLGRERIRQEFEVKPDTPNLAEREFHARWFQVKSALRMTADHPWFGVGGWGFRHLLAHYTPPEDWRRINEGKASAHNDPVQFLAEFGLVGAGAIAALILLLARAAGRVHPGRMPLAGLPLLGVLLVGAQSLVDLPFRSPAILTLWLACLAGASRVRPARSDSPSQGCKSAPLGIPSTPSNLTGIKPCK